MRKYKIVCIEEDDFGCEGRPEGYIPMVSVHLEDELGEQIIIRMEDAVMYERNLDVGTYVILGQDHTLYVSDVQ